jgi:hypothetical protein
MTAPRPYIHPDDEAKAVRDLREFLAAVNAVDGRGEMLRIIECFHRELHREYPTLPIGISTAESRARAAKRI